jgi:hypothetical protein
MLAWIYKNVKWWVVKVFYSLFIEGQTLRLGEGQGIAAQHADAGTLREPN